MYQKNTFAYHTAATEGASQIGLLLVVYDAVARDLLQAADAVRRNSIQRRCEASGHALLLLGHLENWLERLEEPLLIASLSGFYQTLRARILQLQARPAAAGFEELAQLLFSTRAAWKTKEDRLTTEKSVTPTAVLGASSIGMSFHA